MKPCLIPAYDVFSALFQAVSECLSVGAPLLLPPLRERMELLHSLLPQGPDGWSSLTRGQVQLLAVTVLVPCLVVKSLQLMGTRR